MDFVRLKHKIFAYAGKYKYIALVLVVGVLLMMLPNKTEEPIQLQPSGQQTQEGIDTLEERLEQILSNVCGAGAVKVMLSEAQGEQTIYQTDTNYSQSEHGTDTRTQTVLITDSDRKEVGLIHQRNPPKYQGAIILTHSADNPAVKLAIVEAVSNVTGLGADRISVLKMQKMEE